jgi:rubrerythrin
MDFVDGLMRGRVTPLESEAKRVAKENSLAKVLDLAMQAEVDSAAFYEQILPVVDAVEAKAIREIIEEEKRHYHVLTEYRREIKD